MWLSVSFTAQTKVRRLYTRLRFGLQTIGIDILQLGYRFKRLRQLVGARSLFGTAGDSFKAFYHFFGAHAAHEGRDAFEVSVAAPFEAYGFDASVVEREIYAAAAYSVGIKFVCFHVWGVYNNYKFFFMNKRAMEQRAFRQFCSSLVFI